MSLDLQETIYNSKNYTRRRLHSDRFLWVSKALDTCASQESGNKLAIEYGPGSGVYFDKLVRCFETVHYADINKEFLRNIEKKINNQTNVRIFVDDIQESKLEGNYDLILCSEVLEHVVFPEKAIENIYKKLSPAGTAIITTPQKYSLMEICAKFAFLPLIFDIVKFIYKEPVEVTGHISLRTKHQIKSCLLETGFEIIEEDVFGLYIPLLAEFGGVSGGKIIEFIERMIKVTFFKHVLWTQAYMVKKNNL